MTADGVAEGLYAVRHRFSARAAGFGYAVGAVLAWFFGLVTPITFTVESITVATRTSKERPQILYIVLLSAIPSIILGVTGLYSDFVNLLNVSVIAGIIAGVGIILTRVGFTYLEQKMATTSVSIIAGVVTYLITNDLVPVIIAAVVTGSLADRFLPERFQKRGEEKDERGGQKGNGTKEGGKQEDDEEKGEKNRFGLMSLDLKAMIARPVLIGAFSLFALRTGAVVSYGTVNAELANQPANLDLVTLMAGMGSLVSALAGGAPVETTPAPMAAASDPVLSTALFMAIMAGVTLSGLVGRLGRYIPLEAIAGFLVVLGIFVIIPQQLPNLVEDPLPGATALAVTALSNPFYGIIAGELVLLVTMIGLGMV